MGWRKLFSSLGIILFSWIGCALLLVGLCLHPLLEITDPNETSESLKISLWKIQRSNDSISSWSAYSSSSPIPIQIGCASIVISAVFGFLTCVRLNKESASTCSFFAILASFFSVTAMLAIPVAVLAHFVIVKFCFTFWLAVAGSSVLFIIGLFSHANRESIHSTGTWTFINFLFAIFSLGSCTLIAISTSKPTFGNSAGYCSNSPASCEEFLPRTSVGFFFMISLISSFLACIFKFLRSHLRGLAIGLCCLSLGSGASALLLMTSFLSSFFGTGEITDFNYTTVYPGEAYFLAIGGVLAIFFALVLVTVEPVCTVGGERWKMNNQKHNQKVSQCDQSYGFFKDKSEQMVSQSSTTNTISGLDTRKPGEPVRMTLEDLNPSQAGTPIYRPKNALEIF
ncbi:Oidioi.mRNA.OKI2018_I69.PAR.g9874.t1.cds [Oikopleura dioica]|uniref:Oidioi.mRNA.OKI2018_I69.PAR.g9874.t1.cds n=1 Tax=Oikopleura dioica TaxID=34765 RepID=A0ABN7RTJ4_OIKDI|nr:Oidioi.mRNA.OKI2018_I69.PAR.g9874.t1.cds [Oikopleura dioica]